MDKHTEMCFVKSGYVLVSLIPVFEEDIKEENFIRAERGFHKHLKRALIQYSMGLRIL